jgi:hypothetical protein
MLVISKVLIVMELATVNERLWIDERAMARKM